MGVSVYVCVCVCVCVCLCVCVYVIVCAITLTVVSQNSIKICLEVGELVQHQYGIFKRSADALGFLNF